MIKDANIIRKIKALKELAEHPSTEPALIAAAIKKYNDLMEEYNISLLDIELEEAEVIEKDFKEYSKASCMEYIVLDIAALTGTKAFSIRKKGIVYPVFVGLPVDIDYAEWVYNIIDKSYRMAFIAFKGSLLYHKALNERKMKPKDIMESFSTGFIQAVVYNIRLIIADNYNNRSRKHNQLVVVKTDLINTYTESKGYSSGTTSVSTRCESDIYNSGLTEGEKVKFRKECGSEIKGFLA